LAALDGLLLLSLRLGSPGRHPNFHSCTRVLNRPEKTGAPVMKRLLWLDIAKGLAILWVVYFHFFQTYRPGSPSPMSGNFIAKVAGSNGWENASASIETAARIIWFAISGCGYHAVGLFIIVSGWSLAAASARREAKAPIAWGEWYRSRFIRLYPMYWLAHLVYLVSPFVARLEPIDYRFLISLTGLRMIDISMNFMYLNAAWWYFAMLIQLYALFPLLYLTMRKIGLVQYLLLAFAIGFITRYLLLEVWHASGGWILGGNALSRLPEFALGMVLGMLHLRDPAQVERWLLGGVGLVLGLALYFVAPYFYTGSTPYVFADLWTGTCCFLCVVGVAALLEKWAVAAKWIGLVGVFSYGIYLVHQPYVIWVGLLIRDWPAWAFFVITAVVLIVLSAWGIFLEKFANAMLEKVIGGKKKPAAVVSAR
jgi:peptidoglycan/LPS O-acetylase OafA/YrhL